MDNKEEKEELIKAIEKMNALTEKVEKSNKKMEESNKKMEEENKNVEIMKKIVTKWGNSGHIPMPSRYVGQKAIVKVLKKGGKKE